MPISVITDFEELAIYDCTNKPKPTDKASNGRIKYITYDNYSKEFDFIWDTFSKERVLKGSFDKYISSDKNKKGTTTVDHDFLASLDKWRIEIAKNIALRNKILDEDLLNFVVQATIDRIIFLRIAEDRGAEQYGELLSIVQRHSEHQPRHSERSEKNPCLQEIPHCIRNDEGTFYQNLLYRFDVADQKYNSGLFDFRKDTISKHITIDNKVIKSIISELYYPICPYEFSVLSVEILGSAYEQFLGKTISLSKSGRATIEEKPEVRKAGGVYYTPQYIVDYIVKNTVGKLISSPSPSKNGGAMTPVDVAKIKIVDPACGSGSFLIGAYQYLLNWHKDYYMNKFPSNFGGVNAEGGRGGKIISKGHKNNPLTPTGELTTAEKKRILLNNIYGVDLDSNAVEVTKLSLLLKCMEGETKETIEAQTKIFHDRILPTLDNNIKSGNSLIDLDYYESVLDFGEERKIKPFSWTKAFPEVFDRYVSAEKPNAVKFKEEFNKITKSYKEKMEELIDTYVSELEHEYKIRVSGFDCVIGNPPYVQPIVLDKESQRYLLKKYLSNTDLYSMFIEQSIKLLRSGNCLGFIVPSLFLKGVRYQNLRKTINANCKSVTIIEQGDSVFEKVKMPTSIILLTKGQNLSETDFFKNDNFLFFDKIETLQLSEISKTKRGLEIGRDKLLENGNIKCLSGSNIDVYTVKSENFIEDETYKEFSKDETMFISPKILVRETGNRFFATIDYDNLITTRSIYNTRTTNPKYSAEFILGIINSSLFSFYFSQFISPKTNIFPKIRIAQLKKLPIPKNVSKEHETEIIKYVDQLLQLNKELKSTILPEKIEQLKQRIEYSEDRINGIVYELYVLTEEEIKIIEKQ
jgi:type I restriction-modification system DNA methylase subunit